MVSAVKFEQFTEDVAHKVHNLGADTLKVLLTNDAPSASGDAVRADLTSELGTGGGYTSGGTAVANVVSGQTGGVYALQGDDVVFTAAGGTIGPFRYAILYNDTPSSPADPLIQYWDYGSGITLQDGETFTVNFGTNILTLT